MDHEQEKALLWVVARKADDVKALHAKLQKSVRRGTADSVLYDARELIAATKELETAVKRLGG